jgi:hypothetical protein
MSGPSPAPLVTASLGDITASKGENDHLVPSFVPEWWKNGAPDGMKLGTIM